MKKTYDDLKLSMNDAEVTFLNDTVRVVFGNSVLFDFGSATIRPEIRPAFERFAGALNKHCATDILICGYTDSTGAAANNVNLSRKRADSAKAILVFNKVDEKRIFTWGLGAKNAIASNGTKAGRQQNRRVEFVVLRSYRKR